MYRFTNITFYIYKILASGKYVKLTPSLLQYMVVNRAIIAIGNTLNGRAHTDKLCLLCCFAKALDCSHVVKEKCECKGRRERRAKSLCEDYLAHTLHADCGEQRVCCGIGFADVVMHHHICCVCTF